MDRDFLSKLKSSDARRGQATLEYILLLIFVLTFSTLLTRGVLHSYNTSVQRLNSELEKDLKTGKSPIEVFKNET